MLLEYVINGLAVGAVYALVAVGYSLIFGILRILNMAHASLYAFSANILLLLITCNFGIVAGLVAAILLTGLLSLLFDTLLLAPLRNRQGSGIMSLITVIRLSQIRLKRLALRTSVW